MTFPTPAVAREVLQFSISWRMNVIFVLTGVVKSLKLETQKIEERPTQVAQYPPTHIIRYLLPKNYMEISDCVVLVFPYRIGKIRSHQWKVRPIANATTIYSSVSPKNVLYDSAVDVNKRWHDIWIDPFCLENPPPLKRNTLLPPAHKNNTIRRNATFAKFSAQENQLETLKNQKHSLFETACPRQLELATYHLEKLLMEKTEVLNSNSPVYRLKYIYSRKPH